MYFRAQNGTYKRVPQKPNRFLNGANEGITVYYVAPYDGSKVTAFKAVRSEPGLCIAALSMVGLIRFRDGCLLEFGTIRDSECSPVML
jgi:hypothetical protein